MAKVKLTSNQKEVLELLSQEGAKCYLSGENLVLKSTFKSLVSRGYIERIGNSTYPEIYVITEAGKKALAGGENG